METKKNSTTTTTYPGNEYYNTISKKMEKLREVFESRGFSLRLPDQRALRQGCASSHPKAGSCWGGHPRWHGWHGAVFELHPERSTFLTPENEQAGTFKKKHNPFLETEKKIIFHPPPFPPFLGSKCEISVPLTSNHWFLDWWPFLRGQAAFFSQISIQTKKKQMEFPGTNLDRTHQWYLEKKQLMGPWRVVLGKPSLVLCFFRWLLFANC